MTSWNAAAATRCTRSSTCAWSPSAAARRCRKRCRGSSLRASTRFPLRRRCAAGRRRRRQGVLARRAQRDRAAAARAAAEGARRAARRSSVAGETEFPSSTCSCATWRTDRSRARTARRSTCGRQSGSSRSVAPRTTPRCVRTTTRVRSSSTRAAGQSVDGLAVRTCDALREAGDRAYALSAIPQAEQYYEAALELVPEDDPKRSDLLFRLGRTRFFRSEEGGEEFEQAREAFLSAGDARAGGGGHSLPGTDRLA